MPWAGSRRKTQTVQKQRKVEILWFNHRLWIKMDDTSATGWSSVCFNATAPHHDRWWLCISGLMRINNGLQLIWGVHIKAQYVCIAAFTLGGFSALSLKGGACVNANVRVRAFTLYHNIKSTESSGESDVRTRQGIPPLDSLRASGGGGRRF